LNLARAVPVLHHVKSRLGIAQGLVSVVLAVLFVIPAVAGAATTTVGQLAPDTQGAFIGYGPYGEYLYATAPPAANCSTAADLTSAMSTYAVPTGGTTITNWKTRAATGGGQEMTLEVFRKVSDPATYEVIAHDGPHTLTAHGASEAGFVNTFNVSIPVQPGDLVGLYTNNAPTVHEACTFAQSGASYLLSNTALLDGESAAFTQQTGSRPNLTADVSVPSASQHTLSVSVVGTGGGAGTVTSAPAGIEGCASSCSHPYTDGTQVTLSASPGSYSEFTGWSGGGCSGQSTCQVTVSADTAVTAEFAYQQGYGNGYGYESPGGSYGSGGGYVGGNPAPRCHRSKARGNRKSHCVRKTKVVAKRSHNAALGKEVLTNKSGRTLYSLSAEHGSSFICTGSCLSIWHPLTVPAGVRPLGPVRLGTVSRSGIGAQVTYHGRPLYAFGGDTAKGEANGQGIQDVGTWGAVVVPTPKRGH
jgi:predicted lipoprotein with Yx(FWY)xxD motif